MRIEEGIAWAWAQSLKSDCVKSVRASLEHLGPEAMSSGDSGLANVWEEYCAQVQGEHSCDWDSVDDTVRAYVEKFVNALEHVAKLALWARTDDGWDWVYQNWEDPDGEDHAPLDLNSVVEVLIDAISEEATNYESRTLYRFTWGEDDDVDDEEQEEADEGEEDDHHHDHDHDHDESAMPSIVSWAPSGYSAPSALLAVRIRPGPVTERQWLIALADRVTSMAMEAPPDQMEDAQSALDIPSAFDPNEAGQFLVEGNWNLRTNLNLLVMDEDPFPATVPAQDMPEAVEAIEETDFLAWVDHAVSVVSTSSLD